MRAVVQDRYGGPEGLRVEDVPEPRPGPGQVLLRVQAASLHPDVWHVLAGRPYVLRAMGSGLRRPLQRVPGTGCRGRRRPEPISRSTYGRPASTCHTSGCSDAACTRTST